MDPNLDKENIISRGMYKNHSDYENLIPKPLHSSRKFGDPFHPKDTDVKQSNFIYKMIKSELPKHDLKSNSLQLSAKVVPPIVELIDDDDELPKSPELILGQLSNFSLNTLDKAKVSTTSNLKLKAAYGNSEDNTQENSTQDTGSYIYNQQNMTLPSSISRTGKDANGSVKKGLRHFLSTPDCKQLSHTTSESSNKKLNHFFMRRREFKKPVCRPRIIPTLDYDNTVEVDLDESDGYVTDSCREDTESEFTNTLKSSTLTAINEENEFSRPSLSSTDTDCGSGKVAIIEENIESHFNTSAQKSVHEQTNAFCHMKTKETKSVGTEMMAPILVSKGTQTDMENTKTITVNNINYMMLSILGKGGSSEVYQVYHRKKSKVVAIKQVHLANTDKSVRESYVNEINLLKKLNGSARVISLYDFEFDNSTKILNMVMEKGDTDLSTVIRNIGNNGKLEHHALQFYWGEMLKAVQVIHEAGIIHSDLKPANFVLVKGNLKLIDFGIASSIQSDMTSVLKDTVIGTHNFMSPEAIQDICQMNGSEQGNGGKKVPCIKINKRSDVWSLGCILYALTYGKTPFQHITHVISKMFAITNPDCKINYPPANEMIISVLKSCLVRDSKQRASIEDLIAHPFLSKDAVVHPKLVDNNS